MFRHMFSGLRIAALAAALLGLTAAPAFAQYRGGYRGGGYRGGAWYGGGYRGGFYGYRGYGGYRPWYGRGWGVGVYVGPSYFGYNYPAYSYAIPSYDVTPSVESTTSFYPSDETLSAATSGASATVEVRVPADAEVWFDGAATRQRGEMREFSSPPLEAGRDYHYDIRARWMDNGRPVEETRRVGVQAGERTEVDFTRPAGK